MINHRLATEHACAKLFGSKGFDEFMLSLDAFSCNLKDMAEKSQYTMIAHALAAFDEAFQVADLDNDRIIAVSKLMPLSLPACLVALDEVDDEGARELARNITHHESYTPQNNIFIEEVVYKFGKRGFHSNTPFILEGLFKIPYGDEEFDYKGFVETLFEAFKDGSKETIEWAIAFEKTFMNTSFPSIVSVYSQHHMGIMFYENGLKGLGKTIMMEAGISAKGTELHKRESLLGVRLSESEIGSCETEAIACYLLGSKIIEPFWLKTKISGLSGQLISQANHLMNKSGMSVSMENLEQIFSIAVSQATTQKKLKEIYSNITELGVILPKHLADYSVNECLKHFVSNPTDIIEIIKYGNKLVADIDFKPYSEKISASTRDWAETYHLSAGDILSCHFGSPNEFPCTHQDIATAVDRNWSHWSDKDRRVAMDQLPHAVFVKSRQIKGLKISDELGL